MLEQGTEKEICTGCQYDGYELWLKANGDPCATCVQGSSKQKEKCYPVPFGNVTICDNNKKSQCKLWNKKCDNIQEKQNGKS